MHSFNLLIIYSTSAIAATSRSSVPRLLAQRVDWLGCTYPAADLRVISPPAVTLTLSDRLWRKLTRQSESEMLTRRAVEIARHAIPAPDIILCAQSHAVITARRQFPQARIIYWIHSMPTPEPGRVELARQALAAADAVVMPSEALYRALWRFFENSGLPAPVWIIPNTIDTTLFCPGTPAVKEAQRAHLGIAPDACVLAHVGGAAPHKGRRVIETALRLCNGLRQPVVLLSAGHDARQRVSLTPQVELLTTGPLNPKELAAVYRACDLGVLPSLWFETVSLALLEMLASGLPVIAAQTGGVPEVIRDGENGVLIAQPNNPVEWETKLWQLIDNPAGSVKLKARARETAERYDHASAEVAHAWQRLLDSLVNSSAQQIS